MTKINDVGPDANGWMALPAPIEPYEIFFFWDPMCGCVFGHWSEPDPEENWEGGWIYQDFTGDYIEGVVPTHWQRRPRHPVERSKSKEQGT